MENSALKGKIIQEVKKRQLLWKVDSQVYRCQKKKNLAWEEIAAVTKTDSNTVRKIWGSLRDYYKKVSKRPPTGSATEIVEEEGKGWIHYEEMSFLAPQMLDSEFRSSNLKRTTVIEDMDFDPLNSAEDSQGNREEKENSVLNENKDADFLLKKPEKSRKRRKTSNGADDAETAHLIRETMEQAKKMLTTGTEHKCSEDECDTIGIRVAEKLRRLPEELRDGAEMELMEVLNRWFALSRSAGSIPPITPTRQTPTPGPRPTPPTMLQPYTYFSPSTSLNYTQLH